MPDELLVSLSISERRQVWKRILRTPGQPGHILVLDLGVNSADGDSTSGNHVGGFARAWPSQDDDFGDQAAQLGLIYLHPRYWGRGLGRQLHDHMMSLLSSDGYRLVVLWVLRTNQRARRFYERAGWSADGASKVEYLGDVVLDEVRYVRSLDRQP